MSRSLAFIFMIAEAVIVIPTIPPLCSLTHAQDKFPRAAEEVFSEEFAETQPPTPSVQSERDHAERMKELLEGLSDNEFNVRYSSTIQLEKEARPVDVRFLIQALREAPSDPQTRAAIVRALGKTKDIGVLDALRVEFNGQNEEVQLAIVDALVSLRDISVLPFLESILSNQNYLEVHKRAASALGRLGGDRAIYVLRAAFNTSADGPVKQSLEFALEHATGKIDEKYSDSQFKEGTKQLLSHKGMYYLYYHPVSRRDQVLEAWLLICVHGSDLNAEKMYDLCSPLARQYKFALLVPYFDPFHFPEYRDFNVRGTRSDKRLLEVVQHLGKYGNVKTRELFLFGVEQGGEFVERFILAYPGRIARASYLTDHFIDLDSEKYYPFGLKPSPLVSDLEFKLADVIKTDFAILVDPRIENNAEFKRFTGALIGFGEKTQMWNRIRLRRLEEGKGDLVSAYAIATKYMFPMDSVE